MSATVVHQTRHTIWPPEVQGALMTCVSGCTQSTCCYCLHAQRGSAVYSRASSEGDSCNSLGGMTCIKLPNSSSSIMLSLSLEKAIDSAQRLPPWQESHHWLEPPWQSRCAEPATASDPHWLRPACILEVIDSLQQRPWLRVLCADCFLHRVVLLLLVLIS